MKKENWTIKQYPWDAYPIGTKAKDDYQPDGFWIKVKKYGWKLMESKIPDKMIKPVDAGDLKGKIKGFQMVDDYLPIVEFEYCGKKISNAFTLQRISPYKKGKVKPVYIRVI